MGRSRHPCQRDAPVIRVTNSRILFRAPDLAPIAFHGRDLGSRESHLRMRPKKDGPARLEAGPEPCFRAREGGDGRAYRLIEGFR